MTAQTATTAQIADALNTTPRELRKFLRADAKTRNATESLPGKGSRYSLNSDKRSIASLTKKFNAWSASQDEVRKAAKDAKKVASVESVDEVDTDDSDIDPTDAELDMIDTDLETDD